MPNLSILSDNQLIRLNTKVWLRINKALAGGLRFGVDMPTLWAVLPGYAALVVAIRTEGRSRGL